MKSIPFSTTGQKFNSRSGILELMDDLGQALTVQPDMRMLGGGNPAAVPEMQAIWRQRMTELLGQGAAFDRMLGNYDPPQGNPRFLKAMADLLHRTYNWEISEKNLAITTGGQTAFFYLFNLLAGDFGGVRKKVLLPLAPEYIGYADQGIDPGLFITCRPEITWPEGKENRIFKYRIDFAAVADALEKEHVSCIAVSRPTNPTGNVLTDEEIFRLSDIARIHGIPLIIDNAYGAPFPNVIFTNANPHWEPHVILTMSLSKLGLPGTRTAIVVAPPEVATAMGAMTAIAGLSNGNVGQQLVLPFVENGEILNFGPDILRPFYAQKSTQALAWAREFFDAAGVDWAVHASEGAFFHWFWFPGLPISSKELYAKLKQRKVLIVPGEYFFFGLNEPWQHTHECIRLNFSQPEATVREGLQIIAEVVAALR